MRRLFNAGMQCSNGIDFRSAGCVRRLASSGEHTGVSLSAIKGMAHRVSEGAFLELSSSAKARIEAANAIVRTVVEKNIRAWRTSVW
jgi:hypothetical protein